MAIIPTHFYQAVFSKTDMMNVLMKLNEFKDSIQPVEAKSIGTQACSLKDNPYDHLYNELHEIMDLLHIETQETNQYAMFSIDTVEKEIQAIRDSIENLLMTKSEIYKDYQENIEALALLQHLQKENISLDTMKQLHYVQLKFGKMPNNQISKIDYYESYPFVFQVLSTDEKNAWVVYCTTHEHLSEIDNIFSSMSFQHIAIPDFVHGNMHEAIQELEMEDETMSQYMKTLDHRLEEIKKAHEEKIQNYFASTCYFKNIINQDHYLIDLQQKASTYFFCKQTKEEIEKHVDLENVSLTELPVNTFLDKGIEPPVYLSNTSFFKPFEKFARIKAMDHHDPTVFLGLFMIASTILLVGDLGVGVMLLILSFLTKSNKAIIQRIALAMLVGGLFTGTVFYVMPLYHLPFNMHMVLALRMIIYFAANVVMFASIMIYQTIQRVKQ